MAKSGEKTWCIIHKGQCLSIRELGGGRYRLSCSEEAYHIGQLPMYLVQDNHEGIISRDAFNAVKAEFARRNAGRPPSQKLDPTGRSCYSAKYALTERLVCGECGTLYRRCVWVKRGLKCAVWRCASRVDYDKILP